jgi:hypothetical protein
LIINPEATAVGLGWDFLISSLLYRSTACVGGGALYAAPLNDILQNIFYDFRRIKAFLVFNKKSIQLLLHYMQDTHGLLIQASPFAGRKALNHRKDTIVFGLSVEGDTSRLHI